jgi:hypothetical protein
VGPAGELGDELVDELVLLGLFDAAGAGLPDDPHAVIDTERTAMTAKVMYRIVFKVEAVSDVWPGSRWEPAEEARSEACPSDHLPVT